MVLLEKNRYPFHRVCGEYISLESWNFLEKKLEIPLSTLDLPLITQLRITTQQHQLKVSLPLGGFGISRFQLDDKLAQVAVQRGVELLQNTSVTGIHFSENKHFITYADHTISATICVGAFGKRSHIDKLLQRPFIKNAAPAPRNYVGVKYHVKADLPSNLIELHLFEQGYCGISQIEQQKYCMCYLTTAEKLQQAGGSIGKMEQQIAAQNSILGNYLERFERLYERPLAISQINFQPKSAVENHILMVGDAAGLITPLCGNGMSLAFHSADILMNFITSFFEQKIEREELEKFYQKKWNSHFKNRLLVGRLMQHWFFKMPLINAGLSFFKRCPSLAIPLIRLTHGKDFTV